MNYNCKISEYEDYFHVEIFNKSISRKDLPTNEEIINDEPNIDFIYDDTNKNRTPEEIEHCLNVSKNRSKRNLYHIARSNKWDWFITLTFDRKKTDASDYDMVISKLKNWLQNTRKRKCPDLKYLIVPEFHSDGINFHFHGLLANIDCFELEDSGKCDFAGNKIYNITNWKKNYGHCTATRIIDNARVTSYIGKYITKDLMNNLKYKHRFYASDNCYSSNIELFDWSFDDCLEVCGDDLSYIKTVRTPDNQIHYMEISKNNEFLVDLFKTLK